MSAADYYLFQAKARGIRSEVDVDALVAQFATVYSRVLTAWLPARTDAALYEAACGPGILLRWLKASGYSHVTACDLSAPEVAMARSTGFPIREANCIDDLREQSSNSFDCIIAIDFIEHLSKDALLIFMQEAYRTLQPNGSLILRAPNGDSPVVGRNLFNDITHVWAYTTTALRALASMVGFREVTFVDDATAGMLHHRWWRIPLMCMAQSIFKVFLRLATREKLECLGASYYARLRK